MFSFINQSVNRSKAPRIDHVRVCTVHVCVCVVCIDKRNYEKQICIAKKTTTTVVKQLQSEAVGETTVLASGWWTPTSESNGALSQVIYQHLDPPTLNVWRFSVNRSVFDQCWFWYFFDFDWSILLLAARNIQKSWKAKKRKYKHISLKLETVVIF